MLWFAIQLVITSVIYQEGAAVPCTDCFFHLGHQSCVWKTDHNNVCPGCEQGTITHTPGSYECQAYGCTTGSSGNACVTCVTQLSRQTNAHCDTCNPGYNVIGTSCQAPCNKPSTMGYDLTGCASTIAQAGWNPTCGICSVGYTGAVSHTVCDSAGAAWSVSGCQANVCSCPNGSPAVPPSCTRSGATICSSCNSGYTLVGSTCQVATTAATTTATGVPTTTTEVITTTTEAEKITSVPEITTIATKTTRMTIVETAAETSTTTTAETVAKTTTETSISASTSTALGEVATTHPPTEVETTTVTPSRLDETFSTSTGSNCVQTLTMSEGLHQFSILDEFVKVTAGVNQCNSFQFAPRVIWSWRQTSPVQSSSWTTFVGKDSLAFKEALGSFNGEGTYSLRCEAQDLQQTAFVEVAIAGYPPPVSSLIAPTIASPHCDVLLDATSSKDPLGETLSFSWTCATSSVCNELVSKEFGQTVRIQGGALPAGDYTFSVFVARAQDMASSSSTVTVSLAETASEASSVALEIPPPQVSAQVPMRLSTAFASTESCQSPPWRSWWLVRTDGTAWNLTRVEKNVPPSLHVHFLPAPPGDYFLRLVLASTPELGNSWETDQQGVIAYDTQQFSINPAPIGGGVQVNPPVGAPITTTFRISTDGWSDEDTPLTYRIQKRTTVAGGQVELIPLTTFQLAHFTNSIFGSVGDISIQGDARDVLGSVSSAFAAVEVVQESASSATDDYMVGVLESVASYGDAQATVNAIAAVASFKGADKSLAGVMLDAMNNSGAFEEISIEMLDSMATTLNTIVSISSLPEDVVEDGDTQDGGDDEKKKNVPVVDVAVAMKAVDIALELAEASQKIPTGLPSTAVINIFDAASTLLPSLSSSPSDIDTNDEAGMEAKRTLAGKLINLFAEALPDAILPDIAEGETSQVEKNGMRLSVGRLSTSADSTSVGVATLPSLEVLGLIPSDSCSVFGVSNVQWSINPVGFLGNGGSSAQLSYTCGNYNSGDCNSEYNNAANNKNVAGFCNRCETEGGSSPLRNRCQKCCTECSASIDGTQTTEVRACGNAHSVQDLSIPFEFDVPTEAIEESSTRSYDPLLEFDEITLAVKDARSCQYWDTSAGNGGAWSTEGCWAIAKHDNYMRCACTHMSLFGGAAGRTFAKFGNNNAAVIMQPPKIDFSHTPFQVFLVWITILYLPCLLCWYKDKQDYKRLPKRTELFLDRIPRGSGDVKCMCLPSFRICAGLILITPTLFNWSQFKRRVEWLCKGCGCRACCKRFRKCCSRSISSRRDGFQRSWSIRSEGTGSEGIRSRETSSFRRMSTFRSYTSERFMNKSLKKSRQDQWKMFQDMEAGQSQRSKYVGAFGPEVCVPDVESGRNHLLWPSAVPPLRDHIWTVASRAQEETTFANESAGFEHGLGAALAPKRKQGMWATSLAAVRRFQSQKQPAPHHKEAELLRVDDLEKQVMNVKVCHLLVEHQCAKEKKHQAAYDGATGLKKLYHMLRYKRTFNYAEKKRALLLQNLKDLLMQGRMFSVAPSPPPLHALRVEVVELQGELPHLFTDHRRDGRALGTEEAMVNPGQHMFLWLCSSGGLFLHEATRNFFGVWNMLGMRDSIKVPLMPDAPVQARHCVGNDESLDYGELSFLLVGDCSLTVRLADRMSSQSSFEALKHWASMCSAPNSAGIDSSAAARASGGDMMINASSSKEAPSGGGLHASHESQLPLCRYSSYRAGDESEMVAPTVSMVAKAKEAFGDDTVLMHFRKMTGYTYGPRSMRNTRWKYRRNHGDSDSRRMGFVITSVEEGSEAYDFGLQAGMELISLGGEKMSNLSHSHVLDHLKQLDDVMPTLAIFTMPIKANVEVIVRGRDVVSKKLPFVNHGMTIEPGESDHVHKQSWCGLREHDEIITINGVHVYSALGNTNEATDLLQKYWKNLRASPNMLVTFGVRRLEGVAIPAQLAPFFELPSVFKYPAGDGGPHSATPTLTFFPEIASGAFAGVAWISHCGLVLSIHSLQFRDICIGVYVEDIKQVSGIHRIDAIVEAKDEKLQSAASDGNFAQGNFELTPPPATPTPVHPPATPNATPHMSATPPALYPPATPDGTPHLSVGGRTPRMSQCDAHSSVFHESNCEVDWDAIASVQTIPVGDEVQAVLGKKEESCHSLEGWLWKQAPDAALETSTKQDKSSSTEKPLSKPVVANSSERYRLTLVLKEKSSHSESEFHIESTSEFTLWLMSLTLRSLTKAIEASSLWEAARRKVIEEKKKIGRGSSDVSADLPIPKEPSCQLGVVTPPVQDWVPDDISNDDGFRKPSMNSSIKADGVETVGNTRRGSRCSRGSNGSYSKMVDEEDVSTVPRKFSRRPSTWSDTTRRVSKAVSNTFEITEYLMGHRSHSGKDQNQSNFDRYWSTYQRYIALYDPERDDNFRTLAKDVPPTMVAAALAYQSWPNRKIFCKVCAREQIAPKLLRHLPSITRLERYTVISSAVQTGFFFISFLFRADCQMIPRPAVCATEYGNSFVDHFMPTWDTIFATIFGLLLTIPVPMYLLLCFRKQQVVEKLTDDEKHVRIQTWRMWQMAGWAVVVPMHLFYIYWFTIFTNEFSVEVQNKLLRSSLFALLHRLLSAPAIRALAFSFVLISSKSIGMCDRLLVMMPHMLTPVRLERCEAGQIDLTFNPDVQFSRDQDADADVDFGAL